MGDKKEELRFSIKFSKTDETHLQAAAILNSKSRNSKADIIAKALVAYSNADNYISKLSRDSYIPSNQKNSNDGFPNDSSEAVIHADTINQSLNMFRKKNNT